MRLGINAQRLVGQRLGVGRYIEYMLKYWDDMLEPSDIVSVYVREAFDKKVLNLSDSFNVEIVRPRLTGTIWENLPLVSSSKNLDVFFGPSYTLPLTYRGRCVVAIHSLNEAQRGTHPWWYRFTYQQIYKLSAQKADMIIVPSHSTKEDMQQHYGIPEDRIKAIWLGVDDAFRPSSDEELMRSVRRRFVGSDKPYILFVGKLSQRRNIHVLLQAFSSLKKREKIPHSLLLLGPNHLNLPLKHLASELGITNSLVQTDGKVTSHSELVAIYNAADLFVHPSSYEGFCLPLLESMACGVPIVTVNRSALGEIANGSALMVEEPTVDALAVAMSKALNDPDLRRELRTKGLKRARLFRWESTARQTLDLLRQVARG